MEATVGKIDYATIVNELRECGIDLQPEKVRFKIPNATNCLRQGIAYFVGKERAKWLPEYNEVSQWLSDNEGKGLLLYGNCGRGKTLILGKIVPVLLQHYFNLLVTIVDAPHINGDIDLYKSKKLLFVDDIGTESMSNNYGEKRMAFCEVADYAEKKGNLIMATTNLDISQLAAKYGDRTMERIVSTMKCIRFKGASLR